MSTCARCGQYLSNERWTECSDDSRDSESAAYQEVDCRDRELANLRSLLRSVTGRLEKASELLDSPDVDASPGLSMAKWQVDAVLEVLS